MVVRPKQFPAQGLGHILHPLLRVYILPGLIPFSLDIPHRNRSRFQAFDFLGNYLSEISRASRLLSNNHLLFLLQNSGVLCIPFRRCSLLPRYSRPLNIPHHGVSRFRILSSPSHFPLGICHQSAGVAINQPHGIHRITSVILMFWLLFSPDHLWFSFK